MINFIQFFLNGISVGSLYALVALGYSMVFSILKFVNFAHGDLYMLGGYLVMTLGILTVPFQFALPLGMLACAVISVLVNHLIYRPAQGQNRLTLLISAVAVSLLMENLVQLIYTAETQAFPFSVPDEVLILGDSLIIRWLDLGITAITLLTATLLWMFITKTKIGRGIRAVASNRSAALIIGVPVDRIVSATFFIGAALATVAGVLQSMTTNQLTPLMGVSAGLKAFAAAVLGGVGSLWGAVIGGFVLGISESILIGIGLSPWKDSLAFVFLITILLLKPEGLFGTKQVVKV